MDRYMVMLIMITMALSTSILFLAMLARYPIYTTLLVFIMYTLYLFLSNEKAGVHNAQEFENRFWTVFALSAATASFFAKDSPIAIG